MLTVNTTNLISAGKMRSDCGDIRFTYLYPNNTEVEIPYWIESGCNTANTIIWIKVPYIPANGNATVYMYYGNPNAVSKSNRDAVFDFFDDFNGGTKMERVPYPYGDPLVCAYSNNVSFYNDGNYEIIELRCFDEAELRKTINLPNNTYRIIVKWEVRSSNEYTHVTASRTNFDDYYGASATVPKRLIVVDTSTIWEKTGTLSSGYSEITEVIYIGSIGIIRLAFGSGGFDYYYRTAYDYIIIRKYAPVEPSYSFGTEQIGFSFEITNKRLNEYVSLINVTYKLFSKVDSNVTLEFYLNNNLVDTKEYFIQASQTIYDHYIYTIEKEGNHTIKVVANFTTHNYVTEDSFAFNLTLYDFNVTYYNYTTYNNVKYVDTLAYNIRARCGVINKNSFNCYKSN
jgi:Uncharacterized conserved protein